jgi:hypothetical protein
MSVKEAIKREQAWNYERCLSLIFEMKNLQKKPITYNSYIRNISHSSPYPWKATYYTECDEFKNFVKDTKGNNIEFVAHGKYVNFVRADFDYDINKMTYNLVMGTDSEITK